MTRRPRKPRAQRGSKAAAGPSAFALDGNAEISPGENVLLERLAWALIAVLAAVLGFVVFGPHRIGDMMTETDFYGAYAEGARLVQQGVLDPSRYGVIGPGYEVALGLFGFIVRDLFLAAELLSLLATCASVLLWFYIVRRLAGARVALATCLFIATNAFLIRYGYSATTDALALLLQSLALWFLLVRPGTRSLMAAGAIAALAFLTRYNGIYLLPAGVLIVLLGGAAEAPASWKQRIRPALVYAGMFLLPVVPWVLYSLARGGSMSFELHHNIAFEVFARPQGIVWDDYQKLMQPEFNSLWDVIARDPGAVVSRMLFNLGDHLRLDARDLLGWPVAICSLIGLGFAVYSGAWRRLWPLAIAAGLLFLTLVPVFHSSRYSLSLLPLYATLAGACFGLPLFALAFGRDRRVWLKALVIVVPVVLTVRAAYAQLSATFYSLPLEILEAAEVLKSEKAEGDKVIARKGHIGYYAELPVVPFPFVDRIEDLAAYAKEQDARWLYASWVEVFTRARFWFLLDTTATVPGLTPRFVTSDHPAVLYEIGPDFGIPPAWYANDTLRSWYTARAQLMVNPANTQALYTIGQVHHSRGELDEARPALERLLQYDPANFSGWLLLGDTALRQGELDVALNAFDRAGSLRPESPAAQIGKGWAYLQGGRDREAAATWRPVIAATRDTGTLLRMMELYQSLGDAQAVQAASAALRSLQGGGG